MKVVNMSGGPVNFPAAGGDVQDGETVDVPDDTNLPDGYFKEVIDAQADEAQAQPAEITSSIGD